MTGEPLRSWSGVAPAARKPLARRWLLAGAAIVLVAMSALPVGAQPPDSYGWWWKLQQLDLVALPAPPFVPTGGAYIANDPTGPMAVAGFTFTSAPGGTGTLRLKVAEGSTNAVGDLVLACPTAAPIEGVEAGRWASRPEPNCEAASVEGAPILTDLTTVEWKLTAPFQTSPGKWKFVLTPDPASQVPFSVAFAPPDDTAFTVGGASAPAPAAPAPPAPAPPASAPGAAPAPAPGGNAVVDQPGPAAQAPPPQAAAPPTDVGRQTSPVTRNDTRERLFALAILALMALGIAVVVTQQDGLPLPRRVAVANGDAGRGIGRFARNREQPPRRLY